MEYQDQYQTASTNEAYIQPNILELRLDTREIIEKLRLFLSGKRTYYIQDPETGKTIAKKIKEGESLANDLGVQSLTAWVNMIINSASVQGNLDLARYTYFLSRTRKALAKTILNNSPKWEIKRSDRGFIVESIMGQMELFVSRTLDNEERKSYVHHPTMKMSSIVQGEQGKRSFI